MSNLDKLVPKDRNLSLREHQLANYIIAANKLRERQTTQSEELPVNGSAAASPPSSSPIKIYVDPSDAPLSMRSDDGSGLENADDSKDDQEDEPLLSGGTNRVQAAKWIKSTGTASENLPHILAGSQNNAHETHPIFTELLQLSTHKSGGLQWREVARWVKFEEDVEESGNRWSKPHLATLSLQSLIELRGYLVNGIVILDSEATSLEQIAEETVTEWMKKGLVKFGDQEHVKESFLHPPSHQRGQGGWIIRSLAEIGRTYTAKKAEFFQSKECSVASMSMAGGDQAPPTAESTQSPNTNMMRKLPPNVEATNIMVGEMNCLDQPTVAFIRLKNPINLGDLTEVPVATRFLFVLLGPKEYHLLDIKDPAQRQNASKYRQVGRSMATLLTDEVFRVVAYNAATSDHLISGVDEFLGAVTVLPPGGWDPTIRIEPPGKNPDGEHNHPEKSDATLSERALAQKLREEAGLVKSGRLFGGLINDIKRKAPWYFSDFKDGFAMQCVATWFFMYFACLTPIVTFGGMLGDATGHSMSAMESIVSGAIVGVSYALFSGQPLTILGSTGPVLVFDTIIYSFCQRQEWDFLAFRFWIGMWVALMLLIIVAMDWSYTVSFITRFTEENFACLIAFIFIFESFKKVYGISKKYPINMSTEAPNYLCHCNSTNTTFREMLEETDPYDGRWGLAPKGLCEEDYEGELFGPGCFTTKYYPDVFFLSVILFAGTYIIAASLKSMPATPFFPSKVRTFLSDFAVIISITLMTLLDMLFGISTPKLMVPSEFAPTMAGRGWIIDPFRGNDAWWSTIAAAVPAMLCVILVFMDQQITAVIVNRKENKLKKGCGYHLDLLVLALLIAVCSVMGIPWFIAATVRSMNHVNSLRLESECSAPGEKPQFLGIREQRITSLLIGLTIGISVFLTPILGLVPMPVLYGVFLYMGLSSLNGIQVFQRILIMFMPAKYQPDRPFLRKVSMTRVHMFTCVQLACFALLWTVKSFEQTSILFPIMLIVMIAVRKILDKVFTRHELTVLDDLLPEFRRESMNENQC